MKKAAANGAAANMPAANGDVKTERVELKPEKPKVRSSGVPQSSKNIPQLFKEKCVLVTGATGFLGKVLVEKLLRSCPDLKELLILRRPPVHGSVTERDEDFRNNPVFDRLREENPDALHKITALEGDITKAKLGLDEDSYMKVIGEVSVVFHCAANVRFDGEPRNTLITNLLGVKNVLDVCMLCKELEALVHVSTAFSFCNHSIIGEQLYSERVDPQKVVELLGWANDAQIRELCTNYIDGRPSVYHFSKALSEYLIARSASLPVIIVRPSIITASVNEPFPGWIDNYNGPSGFIAVSGKGIVRTLLVKKKVNADWVPVDIVANTLIAAAHYMARRSRVYSKVKLSTIFGVPIVNCVCPESNQITWRRVIRICIPFLVKYPSMQVYGKPGGTVTECPFVYYLCRLMSHYIPAVLIDGARCLALKKPLMISTYNRIHRVMGHMEHYTTHPYTFRSPNMQLLIQEMNPEDKELFPMDQSALDWTSYIESYVLGVRRYFLREKDSTLAEARVKMMRMHYIWLTLKLSSSMVGLFMLAHTLQKRGYELPSSLPSFTYLNSVFDFVRSKFVFN